MSTLTHKTEVVIAGGGLAGIATAIELLDAGKKVLIIDKDIKQKFGGLAKESFGGVHLIDTPHQRRLGLRDNPELAFSDWLSYAQFDSGDELPYRWAQFYCENSTEYIFEFLDGRGVTFLPLVNWVERGLHKPGNSVPRWHIAWGTGHEIITRLLASIERHANGTNLEIWFGREVFGLEVTGTNVVGVRCRSTSDATETIVKAEHVVIASGGVCGGDLSRMRKTWQPASGKIPEVVLNGAHDFGDGLLHDVARAKAGARVTHLDRQWHYAAGVHHPAKRRPDDGLSLVPPRSALWLNAEGRRIMNPAPLVGYTDTRHLVESIIKEPGGYSWQVLNWKIAIKELAVSGCDYMTAFRNKQRLKVFRNLIFGNRGLISRLIDECPEDFIAADSLPDLIEKMDSANLFGLRIDRDGMMADIRAYDDQIGRGRRYFNDEQLRRLMNFRTYRGDRIRLRKNQKIDDPKARPLIAIREFILSRKSLGGIQTDLGSRVLTEAGEPISGLYAVGEAAGFGGGGIHGRGSLEGTFLGSCILTGRIAGQTIASGG